MIDAGQARFPFAITALEQTAGKGRQGRQWVSQRGNLFLTIALSSQSVKKDDLSLVPIKVAGLVSWWIAINFQIRPTIKWPNDLLFAGKKLGGILCESSHVAGKQGPILIGVGLNLSQTPAGVTDYDTICMNQIVKGEFDPARLAHSLARFVTEHWERVTAKDSLTDYSHFCIENGHVWVETDKNGARKYWRTDSLSNDGSLNLAPAENSDSSQAAISLNATSDQIRWLYQRGPSFRRPICVGDVGNSNTKLAFFADIADVQPSAYCSISGAEHIPENFLLRVRETLLDQSFPAGFVLPVHVTSVNNKRRNNLMEQLGNSFFIADVEHRPVRYRGHYDVAAMGQDRLAFIEGVLARRMETPAILVSAGTATTIDFIDSAGTHLGGWICSGVQTCLDGLADAAEALPALDFWRQWSDVNLQARPFGKDTQAAMLLGAIEMTIASVQRARHLLSKQVGANPNSIQIFITGGHGAAIAAEIEGATHSPYAIIDGIKCMVTGG